MDTERALQIFALHRGRMFGIAYRMLGSATEAEDVLQDAWLRWSATDREDVTDAAAFLARIVTNLCITQLQSARVKRAAYVGPWLPEPVLTDLQNDDVLGPLDTAEQRESVSEALLVLLERLTPAERASYVLREAFGYSHREIADVLGISEANARQIFVRAQRGVAGAHARPVERSNWMNLVERFLAAARTGDLRTLETLLAADVVSRSDGGGIVGAARNAVAGRDTVARYLVGVVERFAQGLIPRILEINGAPAVIATRGDEVTAVWFISIERDEIQRLELVLNPEKLAFVNAQLSQIGLPPSLSV